MICLAAALLFRRKGFGGPAPACPACGGVVDPAFLRCPHCAAALKSHCPACSRIVESTWKYCPACRAEVNKV
ncbi:MAG: zinc ribbon domain-containing protein [Desulfobacteraceae bacterium]|nr:zinc ribbon domain-containing protein [Desulfobacteraceae bacterium]